MSTELSIEQCQEVLPPQMKKTLTQEMVDEINRRIKNPDLADEVRNNFIGYAHVLQDGKFKLSDYTNAVMYVSFKVMGATNLRAWIKTFPDKYQRMKSKGVSDKDISSYVSSYNKNKLVNLIYGQCMVPVYILNQDLFQKAINHQAHLMLTARSETVQQNAADSLMTHLKPPEATKVTLDIGISDGGLIEELKKTTQALAAQQAKSIRQGTHSAQDIAHVRIVPKVEEIDDAEYVEPLPVTGPKKAILAEPIDDDDEDIDFSQGA